MALQPVLEVEDLRVTFQTLDGPVEVVKGVGFRLYRGRTLALVGESGSGKSVTARAIMRILPPSARITGGRIRLHDPRWAAPRDLAALDAGCRAMRAVRGGSIAMIFQEPMVSLSPVHAIGDQIAEAARLHRDVDAAQAADLARTLLELAGFAEPDRALKTYPFELSGGLRQRAMIAMALVTHPGLLIADEPTTALDVTVQARILQLIRDLQRQLDMAVLIITHDLGVVANVADDVTVMYRGDVVEAGPARALLTRPRHAYLQSLMNAVPRMGLHRDQRLQPVREIVPDVPKLLADRFEPIAPDQVGRPLLQVAHVVKTFRLRAGGGFGKGAAAVRALDDVSFTLHRGEALGLVGESGCGKTTLSKVVMRALPPDAGSIQWFDDQGRGRDVLTLTGEALARYRRQVQFVFQDPFGSLNPRLTVFELIREPLVIHGMGARAEHEVLVKALLRLVGLAPNSLNRYPHSFSGGQRQRIGIARALAVSPRVLIMDEPVSALDVSVQAQILNLMRDLQRNLGLSYVFISHNLAVVDYLCDRILVMCRGHMVEVAERAALFAAPAHPYTRSLLAAIPHPDIDRPLDFDTILDEDQSDPGAWPMPFTLDNDSGEWAQVGDRHWVRHASGQASGAAACAGG